MPPLIVPLYPTWRQNLRSPKLKIDYSNIRWLGKPLTSTFVATELHVLGRVRVVEWPSEWFNRPSMNGDRHCATYCRFWRDDAEAPEQGTKIVLLLLYEQLRGLNPVWKTCTAKGMFEDSDLKRLTLV
jgi:hypothetical protein